MSKFKFKLLCDRLLRLSYFWNRGGEGASTPVLCPPREVCPDQFIKNWGSSVSPDPNKLLPADATTSGLAYLHLTIIMIRTRTGVEVPTPMERIMNIRTLSLQAKIKHYWF